MCMMKTVIAVSFFGCLPQPTGFMLLILFFSVSECTNSLL